MAPDGDDIKIVGFNSVRDGQERPVALRKERRAIQKTKSNIDDPAIPDGLTLMGILTHANTPPKGKYGSVKLRLADGNTQIISVPISLMKDVVQPFYEENVTIQAHIEKKKIVLDEITLNK